MTSSTPEALWSARAARVLRPAAVRCHRLTRRIGGRALLDQLSLSVPVGARLLLVSTPPESGSLLLRILAGLARRRSGTIQIAGLREPGPGGWGTRVGYVGEPIGVPRWMTPREALRFTARAAGIDPIDGEHRTDALLEQIGLQIVADRPLGRIGPLLAERTALASALLPEPEVILLDEPLAAHAPEDRRRLLRVEGRRRTVVIASRLPARDAELCDHVAFIRGGRLLLHLPIRALTQSGEPVTREAIERIASARQPRLDLVPVR